MKNILFSTTRQWNPGDEFILMGIKNIFNDINTPINPVIYNRNPEIRLGRILRKNFIQNLKHYSNITDTKFNFKKHLVKKIFPKLNNEIKGLIQFSDIIEPFDNSFKESFLDKHIFDYIVFAGSPEWYNFINDELYDYIEKHNPKVLFLGIGAGETFNIDQLSSSRHNVFSQAKLIVTRDDFCYEQLNRYNPIKMPCPALFSSTSEVKFKGLKKIGIGYTDYRAVSNNRIDKDSYDKMCGIYDQIIEQFGPNVEIVCHYIDELYLAKEKYPNLKCHYSYESSDYIKIYSNFDLVLTPRVHGVGLCSSLAIPSIYIPHDIRKGTVNQFKPLFIISNKQDFPSDWFSENILKTCHENLIKYKHEMRDKMKSLLEGALNN